MRCRSTGIGRIIDIKRACVEEVDKEENVFVVGEREKCDDDDDIQEPDGGRDGGTRRW